MCEREREKFHTENCIELICDVSHNRSFCVCKQTNKTAQWIALFTFYGFTAARYNFHFVSTYLSLIFGCATFSPLSTWLTDIYLLYFYFLAFAHIFSILFAFDVEHAHYSVDIAVFFVVIFCRSLSLSLNLVVSFASSVLEINRIHIFRIWMVCHTFNLLKIHGKFKFKSKSPRALLCLWNCMTIW